MIVTDEDDRAPLRDSKAAPMVPPPPAVSPQAAPPPPYFQSRRALYHHHHGHDDHDPHFVLPPPEPAGKRFIKAFLIAILVWSLFGMFTQSIVDLARYAGRHRHGPWSVPAAQDRPAPAVPTFPPDWTPGGSDVARCLNGADWARDAAHPPAPTLDGQHALTTEFALPADAPALYLLARGAKSAGALALVPGAQEDDTVHVRVRAVYNHQRVIDATRVCLLARGDARGVGIFTPARWDEDEWPHDRVRFEVEVVIPLHATIADFSSDMPLFAHTLGDLAPNAIFRTLALHTTNMPVGSTSVYAETLTVQTTNGPIEGTFNASRALVLETSNSPIRAHVTLAHDDARAPTTLVMRTSNGAIDSALSLLSTSAARSGGAYSADLSTSNAPLTLAAPAAPLNHTLSLRARTSNSPASVAVPAAYEGALSARTSSWFRAEVVRRAVDDPAGQGRRRTVSWESVERGKVSGETWWGEKTEGGGGIVDVATSNSPVRLEV